ncbi:phage protein Gp27 family protein [Marinobacter subterrani]|uniref:phage protein Gp27 family protein n=1 Tax=Marinobacter subterrani TaxID=1658765 RepID=UPI000A8F0777|nr:phage protein Gp27 family protein [Marinobacter subterrani]
MLSACRTTCASSCKRCCATPRYPVAGHGANQRHPGAEGHEERLSKSAVNRYAVRMNQVGEKLRQSREVAEMWIAKLGAQPQASSATW